MLTRRKLVKVYGPDLSWWQDHATLIGTVSGIRFYEHPYLGDEAPLIAVLPDGTMGDTDFWELPSIDEV